MSAYLVTDILKFPGRQLAPSFHEVLLREHDLIDKSVDVEFLAFLRCHSFHSLAKPSSRSLQVIDDPVGVADFAVLGRSTEARSWPGVPTHSLKRAVPLLVTMKSTPMASTCVSG